MPLFCLFEALPGGRGGEKKVIILRAVATATQTVQFAFAGPPLLWGGEECGFGLGALLPGFTSWLCHLLAL